MERLTELNTNLIMKPEPANTMTTDVPFGVRQKLKVPISEARIREAEAALKKGDQKRALVAMRSLREGLEGFLRKL